MPDLGQFEYCPTLVYVLLAENRINCREETLFTEFGRTRLGT